MKLKIEKNFTDKYDNSIKYKAGDIEDFTDTRAEELLKDNRNLVSKVEEQPIEVEPAKIEEQPIEVEPAKIEEQPIEVEPAKVEEQPIEVEPSEKSTKKTKKNK